MKKTKTSVETNRLGEPYGIFYTKEEEYTMRLQLITHLRDIIINTLGRNHVSCSLETIHTYPMQTEFVVFYKDELTMDVEVITPTYIKVVDNTPLSSNFTFYLTEDKVDEFILESLDSNFELFK